MADCVMWEVRRRAELSRLASSTFIKLENGLDGENEGFYVGFVEHTHLAMLYDLLERPQLLPQKHFLHRALLNAK